MRKRYSDAEVEAMMIPKIVEAIYPVLVPVEQVDDYRTSAGTLDLKRHGAAEQRGERPLFH